MSEARRMRQLLLRSSRCLRARRSQRRRARRGQQSFERDRARPLSGDCRRLRRLPHRRQAASRSPAAAPIETPFGTIYSPNITPDRETGIGAWTDDDFYRAMHDGIGPDGKHLYPAFPYP